MYAHFARKKSIDSCKDEIDFVFNLIEQKCKEGETTITLGTLKTGTITKLRLKGYVVEKAGRVLNINKISW